jgi:protein-cysteine N-palmitoyltransferase HHAT
MSSDSGYPNQTLPRYTSSFAEPQPIERVRMRLVDLTVPIPSTDTKIPLDEARPPELWKTLEFKFYLIVACVVVPIMAWIPISLSLCTCSEWISIVISLRRSYLTLASHPNYPIYYSRLSPGWIPFRQVVSIILIASTLCMG